MILKDRMEIHSYEEAHWNSHLKHFGKVPLGRRNKYIVIITDTFPVGEFFATVKSN